MFGGGVGPMHAVLFQHFGQRRTALIDASQFAVGAVPSHLLEWRCGKMSLSLEHVLLNVCYTVS